MSKRKELTRETDMTITLEDNAVSSLTHGIQHYFRKGSVYNLKFSILHVFHSVELFLKARLIKEHPLLIYEKPEDQINEDSKTIYFDVVIRRLENCGIKFKNEEKAILYNLKKIRNRVEHHRLSEDSTDIEFFLSQASKFLNDFLSRELKISLKKKLPQKMYTKLFNFIVAYNERLAKAKQKVEGIIKNQKTTRFECEHCSECGNKTVLIPDPTAKDSSVHCFFCNKVFNQLKCKKCGNTFDFFEGIDDLLYEKFPFCSSCQS